MRGTVAKKIRKAVGQVAASECGVDVKRDSKRIILPDGKTLHSYTDIRTLQKSSGKYLGKKIKRIHNKLGSNDRAKLYPVLAQDIASILAKHSPAE